MAGGGYLRLYPHAVTDSYIRRQNRLGRPAMLYFHPWELDTEQPRIQVGTLPSFQHYVNLAGTEGKLDRLLAAHRFGPVKDILESDAMGAMLERGPVALDSLSPRPVGTATHAARAAIPVLTARAGILAA
jgi:hypothetical protein